jgi:hypothetical protein
MYAVALWVFITIWAYIACALPLERVPAAVVAIPLAAIAAEIPLYVAGLIATPFSKDNRELTSFATMAAIAVASAWFATKTAPVRFVAWIFFTIVMVNIVAAVLMLFIPKPECDP